MSKSLFEQWNVGDRVAATHTVYENPDKKNEAGPFPAGGYVHAAAGEIGIVEHVCEGSPTVRFVRTGTATIVCDSEIEKVVR